MGQPARVSKEFSNGRRLKCSNDMVYLFCARRRLNYQEQLERYSVSIAGNTDNSCDNPADHEISFR